MPIPKFPNAYEISISQRGDTLEFTTYRNVKYEIYTQPGTTIVPGFVFTHDIIYFGFYTKGELYSDPKIMPTIINFMVDLLEEPNAIVAFIYSAAKRQEKARERYFNKLFNTYYANRLHKTDFVLGEGDGIATIIFRPDNVNIESLLNLTSEQVIARMEIKDQFGNYYR